MGADHTEENIAYRSSEAASAVLGTLGISSREDLLIMSVDFCVNAEPDWGR